MGEQKQPQMDTSTTYKAADFFLLRAPVLPVDVFSRIDSVDTFLASDSETKACQSWYGLLKELAEQPAILQSLAAASSALLEGIARTQRGEISQRAKRAYSRLCRYIIRMSTRPTPFGLFAGVAVGNFARCTKVQLDELPVRRMRTRPDMDWLLSVIQNVEQRPELLPHMRVVVNQTVYQAGARVILPYADVYGQQDQRSISLRVTPVVQYVLERARSPIPYYELHTSIQERFPQANTQQINRLLQQLWENHILTSNLRPPLTRADPARYILEQISALPGTEPVSSALDKVLQKAMEIDRNGAGGSVELIRNLKELQEQLVPANAHMPFQIDTALQLKSNQLNHAIGEAAAQAGEALLRLSPLSQGMPHLEEYRMAFMERYGAEAEVPLLDLLSPESGLDAPPMYTQPPRTYPLPNAQHPPENRKRDAILNTLIANAINERQQEIELTDDLLQQLTSWTVQTDMLASSSLEVYLQIHAASQEMLDRDEWLAVVSPNCGSPSGGRTFCRFFDLLENEDLERLRSFIKQEELLTPDVIFAELSYLPTNARAANVAIRPALREYEIVINTTPSVPPDKVLHLNELVVGIRNNRFYLRSLSLGKEVVVCQSHMLNSFGAPNICRFLLEIAQDNRPMLTAFDWGASSTAPFLPRIARGKVILSPAQWNVSPAMIHPGAGGSEEERWFAGLQQWRTQWRVPRYVYMVEADNRLLLDLEHPFIAAELGIALKHVGDTGVAVLQEMLPDFNHLWLRDMNNAPYIAEIVVPLIRTSNAKTVVAEQARTRHIYPPRVIAKEERSVSPGSDWTYLKLYASIKQHNGIIAEPLREIVQQLKEQDLIERWFFIRYADPEPHLRIRFRASHAHFNDALLVAALKWGRQQMERGMVSRICVDTYDREIERYGGPKAIDILEQVFMLDSNIVSNIIAAQYKGKITLDSVAVAVFSLDTLFASWGVDPPERLLRLEARTEKYQASKEFRGQRKLLCALLSEGGDSEDTTVTMQRKLMSAWFAVHKQELRELSAQLKQLARQKELWLPEENILDSLAHMHVNRILGIHREQENTVYAFWRHTLESIHRHSIHYSPVLLQDDHH